MHALSPVTAAATAEEMVVRIMERADYLAQINADRRRDLWRIRAILNGGTEAARVLLGDSYKDTPEDELMLMPIANLMESGIERFAHTAGRLPDSNLEPPKESDSEAARRRTEKLLRITTAFDEISKLEMALPQVARWILGYGFGVFIVKPTFCHGAWYPMAEIRDPYECDPAEWGPQQQPTDIAFRRRVPVKTLVSVYPELKDYFDAKLARGIPLLGTGGSKRTSASGKGTWENSQGDGVEVIEYHDVRGTWVIFPDGKRLLDFQPNPEGFDTGAFQLVKRFSFDRLRGQFDSVVGLMAGMARISLYLQAAIEDSVQVETNIIGTMSDIDYKRGRGAVNYLQPGTQVQRPVPQVNFQVFQQVQFLERQLRSTSRYTATLDGESPSSFITGRGVEELRSGVDAEAREIQMSLRHGLQDLTAKMLQYDEMRFDYDKPLVGQRKGEPFEERYRPSRDIKGTYRVKRVYGAMAGFDDASKVAVGANLVGMDAISKRTFMENLDGLENVYREEERIRQEKAEGILMDNLAFAVQQGDPRATMAFLEMLPAGETKRALEKFFSPEGEEMSPEQQMMIDGPPPAPPTPGAGLPGSPPDVQTVLSRIMGGEADAGIQNVGRI